jgi:lipid II:glycine glycyltransferase (peptidoglycan interpeptide bridge formation enzyme)
MRDKTRNLIRRAEEEYSVASLNDPEHFVWFYLENLKKRSRRSRMGFEYFPTVFSECKARDSGQILAAFKPNGMPAAMIFLVSGREITYYLLSTRAPDHANNGAISLLLWKAMREAHHRNQIFDLDGVSTTGTFRFLSGFGGQIQTRIVVRRIHPIYNVARFATNSFIGRQENFTFMPL